MSELSVSIAPTEPRDRHGPLQAGPPRVRTGTRPARGAAHRPCDNPPTMALDDRFDDLIASLGGFHRSWLVYLGLELGPLPRGSGTRVRMASTASELAHRCRLLTTSAIEAWAWAADAHDLVDARRRSTDGRRRRRGRSCSTRAAPTSSAASSSTPRSPRSTGAGWSTSSGPARRCATGPTATGSPSSG